MKIKRNSSGFQPGIKKQKNGTNSSRLKTKTKKKNRNGNQLSSISSQISISTPQFFNSQSQSQTQRRTYRRGPVCGVQNCPSTLYFSLNGHRTCQYGHVMSNDFEFDDDAVPASASGGSGPAAMGTIRRLKLGLDSRGNFTSNEAVKRGYAKVMANRKKEREILYGEEGKELYCNICQSLLEWQVCKMSEILEMDELEAKIYENIVFEIWSKYLEAMMNFDEIDTEKESMANKDAQLNLLKLDLLSLLCIHYLALTMVMKLDIFTVDLVRMIESFELPHLNCLKLFPFDNQLRKLPSYFIKRISGKQIFPDNNVLAFYRRLTFMTYAIRFKENFEEGVNLRFDVEFPWRQFIKKNLAYLHLDKDDRLENLIISFVSDSEYLNEKVRFIPELKSIDHYTLTCFHELNLLASICVVIKSVIYSEYKEEKKEDEKKDLEEEENDDEQDFDDGSKILSKERVVEWISWYNSVKSNLFATQLISNDYWTISETYNDKFGTHKEEYNNNNNNPTTTSDSYIDKYLDFVENKITKNYSIETSFNKTNKMKKRNSKITPILNIIPLLQDNENGSDINIYDLSSSINLGTNKSEERKVELVFKREHLNMMYENVKDLINFNFRLKKNIPTTGRNFITPLEKNIQILQSKKDLL